MKKKFIILFGIFNLIIFTIVILGFSGNLFKESKIFAEGTVTGPVMNSDIFYNYLSWKKSSGIKDYDPLYILTKSVISKNYISSTSSNFTYPNVISDVNGDGLPDIILTNIGVGYSFYNNNTFTENIYYYGLLINKGNMDYEVAYRCVNYVSNIPVESGQNKSGFYGDCAK